MRRAPEVRWSADTAVTTVALVLALVCAYFAVPELAGASVHCLMVVTAFFVAIAVGESLHVSILGVRQTPFMAIAATLAFAMTAEAPAGAMTEFSGGVVIVVTALAMVVGYCVREVRGQGVPVSGMAVRLLVAGVTAGVFRGIPLSDGRSLLRLQQTWADRGWLSGLVMVAVSGLALLLQMVLSAAVRARRERAALRQSFSDEVRAVYPSYAALSTTASLIALAERPLGIAAIPLFLFPLLLMQFSVRRQSAVRATYRQTIRALSRLTEIGGFTANGHSSRVAELAMAVGRDMGLSEREMLDLEYAALLHDIGQVSLKVPIPQGATVLVAPGDAQRIASHGAQIVRETGVLAGVSRIMEGQATSYRQVRELGEDLPLPSRIIKVVNAFDDYSGGLASVERQDGALERIHLGLGYEYDPYVVDALQRVVDRSRS